MTFGLKPAEPIITFGQFAGRPIKDWPLWYLHQMNSLAKDGRILDRDLADHIRRTHDKVKENEAK